MERGHSESWQGYLLWAVIALGLLPTALFAEERCNGGYYLLALAGLIGYPVRGLYALGKQFAISLGAALVCVSATMGARDAWTSFSGVHDQYLNPVSGLAYGIEIALLLALWVRLRSRLSAPLFVSVAALLALVHFDLAGGAQGHATAAVAVLALGGAAAVVAMVRGQLVAGAAALVIALDFVWKVWGNSVDHFWYNGFWGEISRM